MEFVEIPMMHKKNRSQIYLPDDVVDEILLRLSAKSSARCKCVCKRWNKVLQNDVVTEILLRLPAKSLLRFKCVCRDWYNLIESNNFITKHLHHPRNRTCLLTFCGNDFGDYYVLFKDESLSKRDIFYNPAGVLKTNVVLGPVNGLYYLSNDYDSSDEKWRSLWNPSTSEFRTLPSPSFQIPKKCERYFGFGSTDEDVKLVIIKRDYCDVFCRAVALYSLAHDGWKDINIPCIATVLRFEDYIGIYFKRTCYWIASKLGGALCLVLFDMRSEAFREVNLPPLRASFTHTKKSICVRDNCSIVLFVKYCFVKFDREYLPESVDMWEMKEEGQWFKVFSFDPSSTYVSLNPDPHWFMTKDEIVIKTSKQSFVSYNIKSHETRDLEIDRVRRLVLLSYTESLTSVRGRTA